MLTSSGPRLGSLFSGCGGLELGVRAVLGGVVAWHCEVDPDAARVLAHRWPGVPNLGDITAVDWSTVPPVDVLCGGSPCQDLSAAGKRGGMRPGTRSGLWASMCDAIDVLRPRLVVWENVRGALSACAHSDLEPCPGCVGDGPHRPVLRAAGRVVGDLSALGYDARWGIVPASAAGAPHERARVFVAAHPEGNGWDEEWPEPARLVRGLDAAQRGRRAPADASDDRREGSQEHDRAPQIGLDRPRRGDAHRCGDAAADAASEGRQGPGPEPARRRPERDDRAAADANGDAVRQQPVDEPGRRSAAVAGLPDGRTGAPADADGGGRRGAGQLRRPWSSERHPADRCEPWCCVDRDWRNSVTGDDYGPAVRRWHDLTRCAPDPTEPGRNGPRLSPAFNEWMMGLPAGHVTAVPGVGRSAQLRILGNGVVPQQAALAARMLLADLSVVA